MSATRERPDKGFGAARFNGRVDNAAHFLTHYTHVIAMPLLEKKCFRLCKCHYFGVIKLALTSWVERRFGVVARGADRRAPRASHKHPSRLCPLGQRPLEQRPLEHHSRAW